MLKTTESGRREWGRFGGSGEGGQGRLPMRGILEQDSQEREVKAMLLFVGGPSEWTEPRGCKGPASDRLGVGGGSMVVGAKGEW